MVSLTTKKRFFGTKVWFAKRPSMAHLLTKEYLQTESGELIPGYVRSDKFTKVIDLSQDAEALMQSFGKNTRYKINRAEREGVSFEVETDFEAFKAFYDVFARDMHLNPLNREYLRLGDQFYMTKALYQGQIVAMHSYLIDTESKRVRMLQSASTFHHVEPTKGVRLGANRFLHYADMVHFHEKGFLLYDFGGYAYNTDDEKLKRINEFKDEFGGELVKEFNYTPLPVYLFRALRKKVGPSPNPT